MGMVMKLRVSCAVSQKRFERYLTVLSSGGPPDLLINGIPASPVSTFCSEGHTLH